MLKKYLLLAGLIILILIVNTMRFINLDGVPNGFQIDELTSGVTLACLAQDGSAPLGNGRYPLFGENSFASPIPPTYMYPGMLWVKLFGLSQGALRSFTVFVVTIGLLGLFMIGKYLWNARCGLWILLAASISPWTWTISRVAWESLFFLTFLSWGLFFCLKARKLHDFIIAGIIMSGAVYCYPTARLQIPLFLIVMTLYGMSHLKWKIPHVITLGAAFLITSAPLIIFYITNPVLSARFKELAITNPDYLKSINSSGSVLQILLIMSKNFIAHLHPNYLFFKGTPGNLTLSTGQQGIMSWIDGIAVLAGLFWIASRIKQRISIANTTTLLWLGFLGINIVIGILPATLISIDNPHTLRTIGAWPFAMLATGFILYKTTEKWEWTAWPVLGAAIIFITIFLKQYFIDYAKTSRGWFSGWTLEEAQNAKTNEQWMDFLYRYHHHMFLSRYYLMRYHGDNCLQARTTWEKLYPLMKALYEKNNPNAPR
jgi:hypothetical protein